jgi:hypothetical protein
MSYPASDVCDMAASLLNDSAKTVYTNAEQLPYLNIAFRTLGEKLELNNFQVTNETSAIIPVDAGGDNIGGDDIGDPALPTGLIEIQQLWQRPTGTSQPFIPINRYEFLPHYWDGMETNIIPCWAWMGQIIKFIPSNTDIDIKLDFIHSVIYTITDVDDEINVINSLNYLGFSTAALCAMFIGENEERAKILAGQAEDAFNNMLGRDTKGKQGIFIRRRPFMSSYKRRGVI